MSLHMVGDRAQTLVTRKAERPLRGVVKTEPSGPVKARTSSGSEAVVHVEFNRMGRHAQAGDVFHLKLDVAVDQVVGEDAANQ
jgi:hypothetical protein